MVEDPKNGPKEGEEGSEEEVQRLQTSDVLEVVDEQAEPPPPPKPSKRRRDTLRLETDDLIPVVPDSPEGEAFQRRPKTRERTPTLKIKSIGDPRRRDVCFGVRFDPKSIAEHRVYKYTIEGKIHERQQVHESYFEKVFSEEAAELLNILIDAEFISLLINRDGWNDKGTLDIQFTVLKDHYKEENFLYRLNLAAVTNDFITCENISYEFEQLKKSLDDETITVIEDLLTVDDEELKDHPDISKLKRSIRQKVIHLVSQIKNVKFLEDENVTEDLYQLKIKIDKWGTGRREKLNIVSVLCSELLDVLKEGDEDDIPQVE